MDNNAGNNLGLNPVQANVVLTFLLVDRRRNANEINERVLARFFQRNRHNLQPINSVQFQYASSGQEAAVRVALDMVSYNCILLGLEGRGLTGPELTLELRNFGFNRPIYGVTYRHEWTAFMDAGANGNFHWPLIKEDAATIFRHLIDNGHY